MRSMATASRCFRTRSWATSFALTRAQAAGEPQHRSGRHSRRLSHATRHALIAPTNGRNAMSGSTTKTAFGRIFPIRDAWLAKAPAEEIIDPDLPIIDTHHHLWQRRGGGARGESWEVPEFRYLLEEYLADCGTGHNVVGSVFLQCHSMYRAAGPAQMRPVGETEFVAGIAAMSDSGAYGNTKVAAGIVGYADLTAGDWGEPVLEGHIRAGGGRVRGGGPSGGYAPG